MGTLLFLVPVTCVHLRYMVISIVAMVTQLKVSSALLGKNVPPARFLNPRLRARSHTNVKK